MVALLLVDQFLQRGEASEDGSGFARRVNRDQRSADCGHQLVPLRNNQLTRREAKHRLEGAHDALVVGDPALEENRRGECLAFADHALKCTCSTPTCSRRIFCERVPQIARPWARRTERLATQQQRIGVALGGAAGQRLAGDIDHLTRRDTLLRLVRGIAMPEPPPPHILGVDDWAKHKGHTYGTIMIDIERGRIIDLLPDRTADTLAQWLGSSGGRGH